MVAKINRGASLYGAIIYNQQKVNEATARIIAGNRMITDSVYDHDRIIRQTMFAFESYLAANRNTEKPILHISLNPTLDDSLTDSQFADLASAYMQKMGYGNQPYIVYLHEDIDRRHIHIVSTCVNENGEKIDDAYEWNHSMKTYRELERMFGLKHFSKWTDSQRRRADILFREYPAIEEAYRVSMKLTEIFNTKCDKAVALTKLTRWYDQVERLNCKFFNSVIQTIQNNSGTIVNYFENRSTNASAESFNAKVEAFRNQFRGVSDVPFFIFRLKTIFA